MHIPAKLQKSPDAVLLRRRSNLVALRGQLLAKARSSVQECWETRTAYQNYVLESTLYTWLIATALGDHERIAQDISEKDGKTYNEDGGSCLCCLRACDEREKPRRQKQRRPLRCA